MNTWQEAYSGVGCKVLCGTLQWRECGTAVQDMEYCRWVLKNIQSGWPGTRSAVWPGQLVPAVLSLLPVQINYYEHAYMVDIIM